MKRAQVSVVASIDVELEPQTIDDGLEWTEVGRESARDLESEIAARARRPQPHVEVVHRQRAGDRRADWQRRMRVGPAVETETAIRVGDKASRETDSRAVSDDLTQEAAAGPRGDHQLDVG